MYKLLKNTNFIKVNMIFMKKKIKLFNNMKEECQLNVR